jgi:hypothetical protein
MQVTTVGLDLAKHVFKVHGIDQDGRLFLASSKIRDRAPLKERAASREAQPNFLFAQGHEV